MNSIIKEILMYLWIYPRSTSHFFNKIRDHYKRIAKGRIDTAHINDIANKVAQDQCQQYRSFWYKYPKSRKRYSDYKIDDLEHPGVHDILINYFKIKTPYNYAKFCCILLEMNANEFLEYEKSRQDFYNMF